MQNDQQGSTQYILPLWRAALADETAFARAVTPQVTLDGSIYAAPLIGRENVWTAIHTAGGITEALSFTHESTTSERSYLEWEMKALGQRFEGVTVLRFDSSGLI